MWTPYPADGRDVEAIPLPTSPEPHGTQDRDLRLEYHAVFAADSLMLVSQVNRHGCGHQPKERKSL